MNFLLRTLSLSFFFVLLGLSAGGQTTIILKAGVGKTLVEPIFLAGDFNNWNPADSNYLFKEGRLVFPLPVDSIQAKLTGGSWALAEADADGSPRPNRIIRLAQKDSLELTWYAWEKHEDRPPRGVSLLKDTSLLYFDNAYRKIWVYLPADYHQSDKSYPVLYLQDGQNLFQGIEGSPRKWRLAKTLDSLELPLIVVGIAHGGHTRIDELSFDPHPKYGGGKGEAYLNFLQGQLIRYIDSNYRSLPKAKYRFIGGSSLGGLISMWALVEYPQFYQGGLLFSPAYWFNPRLFEEARNLENSSPKLVYQMVGDQEGNEPQEMVNDAEKMRDLISENVPQWTLHHKVVAGGEHNEDLWAQELPEALIWLFNQSPLKEYLIDGKGSE